MSYYQVTIESPGYPGNYPDKVRCTWKIKVPAKEEVHMWCETFDVKKGDRLSVYNIYVLKVFSLCIFRSRRQESSHSTEPLLRVLVTLFLPK